MSYLSTEPPSLDALAEAQALWTEVEQSYSDERAHERFIFFCQRNRILDFAAQKYKIRLEDDPTDPIGLKFRQQVKAVSHFIMSTSRHSTAEIGESIFDKRIELAKNIGFIVIAMLVLSAIALYVFMPYIKTP